MTNNKLLLDHIVSQQIFLRAKIELTKKELEKIYNESSASNYDFAKLSNDITNKYDVSQKAQAHAKDAELDLLERLFSSNATILLVATDNIDIAHGNKK